MSSSVLGVISTLIYAAALMAAATPATHAASIDVGSASGAAGQQVTFAVTLSTMGEEVAGTQNDISFDPVNTPIAPQANGKPDCAVNGDINKDATSFSFQPTGCSASAGTCHTVRALVLATYNTFTIPDGAVLYTCKVNISETAAVGRYALSISGLYLSDPSAVRVPATGSDGEIVVLPIAPPSATPTKTPRPSCFGDCNSDGEVTVDELITMVSVALGSAVATGCAAGDVNGDGEITIDEILTAVNNALNECSTSPPPTPPKLTPTSTPPHLPATNTPRPSARATSTPTQFAARTSTPTFTWTPITQNCQTGTVDCIVIESAENVQGPFGCTLRVRIRSTAPTQAVGVVLLYRGSSGVFEDAAAVGTTARLVPPGGTEVLEGGWAATEDCSAITSCRIDRTLSSVFPCF